MHSKSLLLMHPLWGFCCPWEPGSIPALVPLSTAHQPWSLSFPLTFVLLGSVNELEEPCCHSHGCLGRSRVV